LLYDFICFFFLIENFVIWLPNIFYIFCQKNILINIYKKQNRLEVNAKLCLPGEGFYQSWATKFWSCIHYSASVSYKKKIRLFTLDWEIKMCHIYWWSNFRVIVQNKINFFNHFFITFHFFKEKMLGELGFLVPEIIVSLETQINCLFF
jgi:hypothetical protein